MHHKRLGISRTELYRASLWLFRTSIAISNTIEACSPAGCARSCRTIASRRYAGSATRSPRTEISRRGIAPGVLSPVADGGFARLHSTAFGRFPLPRHAGRIKKGRRPHPHPGVARHLLPQGGAQGYVVAIPADTLPDRSTALPRWYRRTIAPLLIKPVSTAPPVAKGLDCGGVVPAVGGLAGGGVGGDGPPPPPPRWGGGGAFR